MRQRSGTGLLREAFREWRDANASNWAASLAFYTALSLGPVLIIAVAVAGMAFGHEAAQSAILEQVQTLLGHNAAEGVATMLRQASQPTQGFLAAALGFSILVLGAIGVFSALQDAMNAIWQVQPRPDAGVWSFLKRRLVSFAMVLGLGFLLLVSLVLSAALAALQTLLPLEGWPARIAEALSSFALVTLLFAAIFKFLPDAKIRWRDVWVGSAATAFLFGFGKALLGLYLGRRHAVTPFGAAGSVVLVLLWVYYSAQILFFGAAFTRVYAQRRGSGVHPRPDAVAVRTVPVDDASGALEAGDDGDEHGDDDAEPTAPSDAGDVASHVRH